MRFRMPRFYPGGRMAGNDKIHSRSRATPAILAEWLPGRYESSSLQFPRFMMNLQEISPLPRSTVAGPDYCDGRAKWIYPDTLGTLSPVWAMTRQLRSSVGK